MGLKVDDKVPLFAVVSRLTSQKGLDLVLEALPGLLEQGGQLALLGAGRSGAAGRFPCGGSGIPRSGGRSDWLSRSIFASHYGRRGRHSGAQPFEPCGLTQLYGLKYGTLPLVRRTGGLLIRFLTVLLRTLQMASPVGLSLKIVMPGRCYGLFGVLLYCGPVLHCGGLCNVRLCNGFLAGRSRRSRTVSFTIA
ncbi:glycogen synthase [Escherichia coli]|uniref:Glycogen synthase n=1 Tax=Escherichia coli TaxID=562 RepID=A0A376TXT6_ECOLX|nr:glycogen synthase [Escherichia coli]